MNVSGGRYTIRIAAKDADGAYTSKYLYVDVSEKPLEKFAENNSYLSSYSVYTGQIVTAYAKFKGGSSPYQYRYSIRKDYGEWKDIKGYCSDESLRIMMPNTCGFYTIRIAAKDADGAYASKYLYITIKKNTGKTLKDNGSTLSQYTVPKGKTITANAKFTGGTAPYLYKYSYRVNNGTWTDITDFTTAASKNITFYGSGRYTVRITVKDADGKFAAKSLTLISK